MVAVAQAELARAEARFKASLSKRIREIINDVLESGVAVTIRYASQDELRDAERHFKKEIDARQGLLMLRSTVETDLPHAFSIAWASIKP